MMAASWSTRWRHGAARYKRTSSRCYSVSLEEFEPIRWRSSWCKRHEPLSLENLIHAASKCSPDTASAPMSGLQYRGVEIVELAALFVAGGTRPPHKLRRMQCARPAWTSRSYLKDLLWPPFAGLPTFNAGFKRMMQGVGADRRMRTQASGMLKRLGSRLGSSKGRSTTHV